MTEPRTEPDWIVFNSWQGADDEHPSDGGHPGYRLVFKTMRVAIAEGRIEWPNLGIKTGHGTIGRGGVEFPGALPARQPGKWVLPEFGHLVPDGSVFRYEPTGVRDFVFTPWEDEIENVFYVEFLLRTAADKPPDQIIEGRERLAEIKTMFDIRFGPRILGAQLAEEAGRVFDDWHFVRSIASEQIGHEFQFDVIAVSAKDLTDWQTTDMGRFLARPDDEKSRLRLGSQWYWLAIHERDPVNRYLALWFVVEVLAMQNTTDVRPVRELLALHVGGTESEWSDFVGRHFGRRSKLVHGNAERTVTSEQLESLFALVVTILEIELSSLTGASGHAEEPRRPALIAKNAIPSSWPAKLQP